MKKHSVSQFTILLILILTACSENQPVSTPAVDPSAVAAVVSTVMAGNPAATPIAEPAATSPLETQTLLPRSLYYLAHDANGKTQIYRLGRDGVTVTEITFEQNNVINFDISEVNGTIAYIVQNSLVTVDSNGANRRTLVQDTDVVFDVAWSLDGKMIAYGTKQVTLYFVATGASNILLSSNDADYSPVSFSPDGKRLLVRKRVIPSATEGRLILIYNIDDQMLTPVAGGKPNCFDGIVWITPNEFFCYKYAFTGGGPLGLYKVNAITGSVEDLVSSMACPPCTSVAAPFLSADRYLYYLYGEASVINTTYPALSLVRSKSDGNMDRSTLRPESFNVFNALWTPDGRALVIIQGNGTNSSSSSLMLVPRDPSLPVVRIMADAGKLSPPSLHWGQ